jgi:hypothetical protein
MDGSLFCIHHQDITPEDHKDRWISKFLLAADGNPFLYQYDTFKQDRILGDLRDGVIVLTQEDIDRIVPRRKFIDIYILLFENGYIDLEKITNKGMYMKCLDYLSDFWTPTGGLPLSLLGRKVIDVLIQKDAEHMAHFLRTLPLLVKKPQFGPDRMPSVYSFMLSLQHSKAGQQYSWYPQEQMLNHYKKHLAVDHPLLNFFENTFVPTLKHINRAVKRNQKNRMDPVKEQLMAITWHPDRFITWCLDEEEKADHQECVG